MKKAVLSLIRFYQRYLSVHKACRFTPSCSEYTYQAILKYGILKGSLKGLARVVRCHPFNKGGEDPLQ